MDLHPPQEGTDRARHMLVGAQEDAQEMLHQGCKPAIVGMRLID